MKNQKPEPKKGGSKIDALRAERERLATEREARTAAAEKLAKCKHPRVDPKMGDIGSCLDCGDVVRVATK
jgi:hypothetical protein